MSRPEAERIVFEALDGVSYILLIPYYKPPVEKILTVEGKVGILEKVSGKDVLYYKEVENAKADRRGLFR